MSVELLGFLGKWAIKTHNQYLKSSSTNDIYADGNSITDTQIFLVYMVAWRERQDSPPLIVLQSQSSLNYLGLGSVFGVNGVFAANATLDTALQFKYSLYEDSPTFWTDTLGNGKASGIVVPYNRSPYYLGYYGGDTDPQGAIGTPDLSYEVIYTAPSTTQLEQQVSSGDHVDFRNVVLKYVTLSNLNFYAANFSASNLSNVNFAGSDMRGAKFIGASLGDITFTSCNLSGADFTGAVFTSTVDFRDCNLSGASLPNVDLTRAAFSPKTIMRGVLMKDANLDTRNMTGVDFSYATLQGASFDGTNLSGATLVGTILTDTDLTNVIASSPALCSTYLGVRTKFINARVTFPLLDKNWSYLDLTDARFSHLPVDSHGRITLDHLVAHDSILTHLELPGANLQNAQFDNSFLTGANLTEADLSNASLKNAWLEGDNTVGGGPAQLAGAKLFNTDLSSAHLSGVDFSGAYLYGQSATVAGAMMKLVKFPLAYLANMDFSGVDLTGADFAYACLVNARFVGAILSEYQTTDVKSAVSLYKACLQGADFSQSTLNGADLNDAAVATTPGSISVMFSPPGSEPFPMTVSYPNATTLPQSTTNSGTVCPNGSHGPCAASQLISDEAPTQWPSKA